MNTARRPFFRRCLDAITARLSLTKDDMPPALEIPEWEPELIQLPLRDVALPRQAAPARTRQEAKPEVAAR